MIIMLNFIEELFVCYITEFLKGWEIWLTKSAFLVTPQECVNSLLIAVIDQSRPNTTCIHNLGDNNRPKNGMKSTATQAMSVKNPQSILCIVQFMHYAIRRCRMGMALLLRYLL